MVCSKDVKRQRQSFFVSIALQAANNISAKAPTLKFGHKLDKAQINLIRPLLHHDNACIPPIDHDNLSLPWIDLFAVVFFLPPFLPAPNWLNVFSQSRSMEFIEKPIIFLNGRPYRVHGSEYDQTAGNLSAKHVGIGFINLLK